MQNNQDGTIDPHGLCTALSRYATRSGAKVFQMAKDLIVECNKKH